MTGPERPWPGHGLGSWRITDLPVGVQRYIEARRSESASRRLEVLAVRRELLEVRTALRRREVELAAALTAASEGLDAAALLDSVAFAASLAGLDAAAPGFADQLQQCLDAAAARDPQLRLSTP